MGIDRYDVSFALEAAAAASGSVVIWSAATLRTLDCTQRRKDGTLDVCVLNVRPDCAS